MHLKRMNAKRAWVMSKDTNRSNFNKEKYWRVLKLKWRWSWENAKTQLENSVGSLESRTDQVEDRTPKFKDSVEVLDNTSKEYEKL